MFPDEFRGTLGLYCLRWNPGKYCLFFLSEVSPFQRETQSDLCADQRFGCSTFREATGIFATWRPCAEVRFVETLEGKSDIQRYCRMEARKRSYRWNRPVVLYGTSKRPGSLRLQIRSRVKRRKSLGPKSISEQLLPSYFSRKVNVATFSESTTLQTYAKNVAQEK